MSNERIPKFKITSANGNTLVTISERGLVPRGCRADMKLFDESSSGYKYLKNISEILSNDAISNIEITLKALGVSIKNEDNTYRNLVDILDDLSKAWNKKIEQQDKQSKMDKLEELCRPISDYLRENYCPHDSVVITDDKIRLVRDEMSIPVDRDCEEDEEYKIPFSKALEEYLDSIEKGIQMTRQLKINKSFDNFLSLDKIPQPYKKVYFDIGAHIGAHSSEEVLKQVKEYVDNAFNDLIKDINSKTK